MAQSFRQSRKRSVNPDTWVFYMVTQANEMYLTATQVCKRPAQTANFKSLQRLLQTDDEISEIGYVRASQSKNMIFKTL